MTSSMVSRDSPIAAARLSTPTGPPSNLSMIEKFDGGPVGVDSLAAAISEERGTIEDVLEPYLIQQGYVLRTPRGRMVTRAAYLHFGLQPRGTLATPDMLAGAAESP